MSAAAPVTGHVAIDAALAEVSDLTEVPVGEHYQRLLAAQEVLAQVLDTSRDTVQTPNPGVQ